MRRLLRSSVAILFALATARGTLADTLEFAIRPIVTMGAAELDVTLRFEGDADGTTEVQLPQDWYGTPRMFDAVRSLAVTEPADVTITEGSREFVRVLHHAEHARITLNYRMSWNPANSVGRAYSPSVGEDHAHFLGSQWLVRVGDPERKRTFRVQFCDLPPGWQCGSSFGIGLGPHTLLASIDDVMSSFIAMGRYRAHAFQTGQSPVRVMVHASLVQPDAAFFEDVERAVRAQRNWFSDHSQPFYTICLTEREGILAGTAFLNSFVCFIEPNAPREQLLPLLAHELFHDWVPGTVRFDVNEADPEGLRTEWLHEGLTEYFSRRILVDAGQMDEQWFVDRLNQDLYQLSQNPHATMQLASIIEEYQAGRYTNVHKKLGYLRGTLAALTWDSQTETRGGLGGVLQALVAEAAENQGVVPLDEFATRLRLAGAAVQTFMRDHVHGGKQLSPPTTILSGRYVATITATPAFDVGFDVAASRRGDVVQDVIEGGPAFRAGLRDGMELVHARNTFMFTNAWRPGRAVVVTVLDDTGKARAIEYLPEGDDMRVWQYVPRASVIDPE